MLDHARTVTDADGPDEQPGRTSGDGAGQETGRALAIRPGTAIVPVPVDPATARELKRYLDNSRQFAEPTAAQRLKRRLAARREPALHAPA